MITAKDIASEFAAFRRRSKMRKSFQQGALRAILEKRAVFIHVPKCGGKTVIKDFYGLKQHDWFGHAKPGFYKALLGPARYRVFFKFSLVRDPIERCRSGFYFGRAGGFGTNIDQDFAQACRGLSFEEFVLDGHLKIWADRYVVFYPQHPFVAATDGSLLVDRLYRLEQIDELFQELGLGSREMSHQNKTIYHKFDLSLEVTDAIRVFYQRDYDVIGFS